MTQAEEIPGLSVATIDSAGHVRTQTRGLRKAGEDAEVSADTVFEAASLSKSVFAYIVIKMAERGELDLDAPLHILVANGFGPPHLRETETYRNLTARNVLSHQADLPNWPGPGTPEDPLAGEKFVAKSEERFDYYGFAYCFLQEVIEQKTGKNFEDIAQAEFAKLGMDKSTFYQPEAGSALASNMVLGH